MGKTTIIMPVWISNDELYDLTDKALVSLRETIGGYDELIIIDNGSPIGGDQLQKVSEICIRNKTNLGYAKAVNQGFKLASGDFITVANNDIRVSSNWLIIAREIFERLPKAGSVHFRMIGYDENTITGDEIWVTGKERWCSSSFYIIRKEAISKGGYDENYGLGGGEDWDFWKRVRDNGWETVYTNGAYYQHKDSSTSNTRNLKEREESDKKAAELFKQKFGVAREVLFEKEYPGQLRQPWRPFP